MSFFNLQKACGLYAKTPFEMTDKFATLRGIINFIFICMEWLLYFFIRALSLLKLHIYHFLFLKYSDAILLVVLVQVTHVGAVSIADLVKTTLGPKGMVYKLSNENIIFHCRAINNNQFNWMMHACGCRTKFYSPLGGGALLQLPMMVLLS